MRPMRPIGIMAMRQRIEDLREKSRLYKEDYSDYKPKGKSKLGLYEYHLGHEEAFTSALNILPDYTLLTQPLTIEQMKEMRAQHAARFPNEPSWIEGVVPVDLDEIGRCDFEGFLDLISERLTGTELLMNIDYEVVGFEGKNVLHMKVGGDPEMILEEEDDPIPPQRESCQGDFGDRSTSYADTELGEG